MPEEGYGELFLVRLWHEPSESRGINQRGYVEHVTSKQRMYFSDLADLNDFLRFRLGDGGLRSPREASTPSEPTAPG
jgi:hypothetical protein